MTLHDETGDGSRIELASMRDPNEGAFTVSLPRGWRNQAFLVRPHGAPRSVINSTSPDGAVFLFWGDPQMPAFSEPTPEMYPGHPMAGLNPMLQVYPYVPAEPFFVDYVRRRHGGAPGFRLVRNDGACAEMERGPMEEARNRGLWARATSVSLSFEFVDPRAGTAPVRARLHGVTFTTGAVWVAELCGAQALRDDAGRFDDLLFAVNRTRKTDPRWQQMQNQGHSHRMNEIQEQNRAFEAQLQRNHQDSMSWIAQSAQDHQARMDSLHAVADAQVQGWNEQQRADDAAHRGFMDTLRNENTAEPHGAGRDDFSHRRFLNTVTDQETVVGPDGNTYQVEAGHERYYRHTRDDTVVGTDATVERDDLRSRLGVNPDDYEEVRIRR